MRREKQEKRNHSTKRRIRDTAVLAVLLTAILLTGCSLVLPGIPEGFLHRTVAESPDQNVQEDSMQEEPIPAADVPMFYAYEQLDDAEREVYDEIVYALTERDDEVRLSTTDLSVMERAYQAVRYDHPEIFWLEKFSYVTYSNRKEQVNSIVFRPEFSVDAEEQERLQQEIDAEAERMLADVPSNGSDYDKALSVYETLIREVDYDTEAENNQNLISTFLGHKTVCQGYSYGMQYLLQKLGIPCTTVEGDTEGAGHSWNLVFLDGAYYYVDATWGNSQFTYYMKEEESTLSDKFTDYNYFGMDSEQMQNNRTPSEGIPLPDCNTQTDNYFVHEGLLFSEWDADQIGGRIREAYENGEESVQLKFADTELYEQAMQYFLEDYHIASYCRGLNRIRYLDNSDQNVLFLLFKDEELEE